MPAANLRKSALAAHWPLVFGLGLLWALAFLFITLALGKTGGRLIYPLDDPYIHMALAKHLIAAGTFGVAPGQFTNACSSPLWALLLAGGYLITGVNDWLPLLLNALFASAAVATAYVALVRYTHLGKGMQAFLLALFVLLPPLPTLLVMGMEHSLHVFAALGFMLIAWRTVITPSPKLSGFLVLLSALLPVIRFESVFLFIPLGVWLLFKRRFKLLAAVVAASFSLVLVYGLVSLSHGWPFFPVSILLKNNVFGHMVLAGDQLGAVGIILNFVALLEKSPHMLPLFLLALLLGYWLLVNRQSGASNGVGWLLALALCAAAGQVFIARTGWLYRYEAWSIALLVVAAAVALSRVISQRGWTLPVGSAARALLLGLVLLLLYLPLMRSLKAGFETPLASQNMYQQPFQTARFLKANYAGQPVLLNDLGMAVYYGEVIPVDMVGLGTQQLAQIRLQNPPDITDRFLAILHELKPVVGVLHPDVPPKLFNLQVSPAPGDGLRAVAAWRISNNVIANNSTVWFVAMTPDQQQPLVRQLQHFVQQAGVPAAIEQTYFVRP